MGRPKPPSLQARATTPTAPPRAGAPPRAPQSTPGGGRGPRADRRADRRPVVHREVRPQPTQDRMTARMGEAGGDAGEVERGAQEHLPHRAPGSVVVLPPPTAVLPSHAREQRAAGARVLRDQDVAVAQERVADVALLHEEAEAVTRQRVGREVEVPLEEGDEPRGEAGRLAATLDPGEEGAGHLP